jgi:hypothetical protein
MSFSLIFEVDGDSTIFQNDWIGRVFLRRAIYPGQKQWHPVLRIEFLCNQWEVVSWSERASLFLLWVWGEGRFFIFKCGEWIVHCSLSSWTVDTPLSMQALFICLFLRLGGLGGGVRVPKFLTCSPKNSQ